MPKQTQGATFGEKVGSGLQSAGSAVAQGTDARRHDTAKNAIGNVRRETAAPPADAPVDTEIGPDGRLAGSVAAP